MNTEQKIKEAFDDWWTSETKSGTSFVCEWFDCSKYEAHRIFYAGYLALLNSLEVTAETTKCGIAWKDHGLLLPDGFKLYRLPEGVTKP